MFPVLLSTADPSSESKEDQWMGVTVQSQGPGGKVVVSVETQVLSLMLEHLSCAGTRVTVANKTEAPPMGNVHCSHAHCFKAGSHAKKKAKGCFVL